MSLLDDARRMADGTPCADSSGGEYGEVCAFCDAAPHGIGYGRGPSEPDPHKPDCPWLSMPRIVAALEAAHHFIFDDDGPILDGMEALKEALESL